ncbi:MAG: hypothetical protein ACK52W_09380, partial [Alphaproteobacteria bacterium]
MSVAKTLVSSQGNIMQAMESVPGVNTVTQAVGELNKVNTALRNLPNNLPLSQITADLAKQIPGYANLPKSIPIGDLKKVMDTQIQTMQKLPPDTPVSEASAAATAMAEAVAQLPDDMSTQKAGESLANQADSYSELPPFTLAEAAPALEKMEAINGLDLPPEQLGEALKSQSALLENLPEGVTPSEVTSDLADAYSGLMSSGAGDVGELQKQYESQIAALGSNTTIASGSKGRKDERCLLGGWGGPSSFGGVSVDAPDPVTSWTELKLYQARTARKDGVYCIGRYDKVFKPESTEEKILSLAGGDFNVLSALPGETKKTNISKVSWPLAWRGYL